MFLLVEGGRREDTERKQSAVTFRTRPHRTLSGLAFACRTQFFTGVPVALPSRLFCPSDLPLSAAMAASLVRAPLAVVFAKAQRRAGHCGVIRDEVRRRPSREKAKLLIPSFPLSGHALSLIRRHATSK